MAKKRTAKKRAPLVKFEDTYVETWFERDRSSVDLRKKKDDATIIDWWDEAVAEAIDDGFLNSRDYHKSAYQYALNMGIIRNK